MKILNKKTVYFVKIVFIRMLHNKLNLEAKIIW